MLPGIGQRFAEWSKKSAYLPLPSYKISRHIYCSICGIILFKIGIYLNKNLPLYNIKINKNTLKIQDWVDGLFKLWYI
jgi:hypothetical protein